MDPNMYYYARFGAKPRPNMGGYQTTSGASQRQPQAQGHQYTMANQDVKCGSMSQYENQGEQYDSQRPPYDNQRDQFDDQRMMYDSPRESYNEQRPSYENQRTYDSQRPPQNGQRPLSDNSRPQCDGQRSQSNNERPHENQRSQGNTQKAQKMQYDMQKPPPTQRPQQESQRPQTAGQRPQSGTQRPQHDSPHHDSQRQQQDVHPYKAGSKQDPGPTERQGGGPQKQHAGDPTFENMQTDDRHEGSGTTDEYGNAGNYYDYGQAGQYEYGDHGMYDGYGYGYGYGEMDYYGSYDQQDDYGGYQSGGIGNNQQGKYGNRDHPNYFGNYNTFYRFGPKDLVHNFGTPPPPPPPPPARGGSKDPVDMSGNDKDQGDGYGSPSMQNRFGNRDQGDGYGKGNPRFGNNGEVPDYRKPPPNYYGHNTQMDGYGNAQSRYNSMDEGDNYGNSYPPNRYGSSEYHEDYRGGNRFGNGEPPENSMKPNQMNRDPESMERFRNPNQKNMPSSLLGTPGTSQSNKNGNNAPSSLLGTPDMSGQKALFSNPPPGLLNMPDGKQQPSLLGFPDANMFNKFTSAMLKLAQQNFPGGMFQQNALAAMFQQNRSGGLLETPNMEKVDRGKAAEIAPPSTMDSCKEPERFNDTPKKVVAKKPAPQQAPTQVRNFANVTAVEPGKNTVHFDLLTGRMIGQKQPGFAKPVKKGPPQPQMRFSKRAGLGLKSAISDGQIIKSMKGQKPLSKAAMKMVKNKASAKMVQKQAFQKQGQQNRANAMKMMQRGGQSNYSGLGHHQSMAFQNPWAKKGQLHDTTPVTSQFGLKMLRKMGWTPGEGLGKNKKGTLVPLLVDVKMDRRGFHAKQESAPKKAAAPKLKEYNGKHPVSALIELCTRREWPPPEFELIYDHGPDHKKNFLMKVIVNGHEFKPSGSASSKKLAKANAAAACLGRIKDLFPEPPPKPKTENASEGEQATEGTKTS